MITLSCYHDKMLSCYHYNMLTYFFPENFTHCRGNAIFGTRSAMRINFERPNDTDENRFITVQNIFILRVSQRTRLLTGSPIHPGDIRNYTYIIVQIRKLLNFFIPATIINNF
jgi:hypothetical protein